MYSTYISTRTKLVPWIDQVYQHQLTQNNHSTYPIIFDRKISLLLPSPRPIDIRTRSVFMTRNLMDEEKYSFTFLPFLDLTTNDSNIIVWCSTVHMIKRTINTGLQANLYDCSPRFRYPSESLHFMPNPVHYTPMSPFSPPYVLLFTLNVPSGFVPLSIWEKCA